jgi:hypothetical protein
MPVLVYLKTFVVAVGLLLLFMTATDGWTPPYSL